MSSRDSLVVLDVGHGNCSVVIADEQILVIDAGRGGMLLQYLTAKGISEVSIVILSHADADHVGGLVNIMCSEEIHVRKVIVNTDSSKGSSLWQDILLTIDDHRRRGNVEFQVGLTSSNSPIFEGGHISVEVIGPSPYLAARGAGSTDSHERRITSNSISAVIRINWDNEPVALLAGDVDGVGLINLQEENLDCAVPVLVFPHHGGNPGSIMGIQEFTEQLLKLTNPSTVIFSIGREAAHEFPRREVVASVLAQGSDIRIACTQLSKRCAANTPSENPSHLNPLSMGAEKKTCCAGTITIPLQNVAALNPPAQEHKEFIRVSAPTALCRN